MEYTKRSEAPNATLPEVLAKKRIDPKIGPMQGLHPKPKKRPSKNAEVGRPGVIHDGNSEEPKRSGRGTRRRSRSPRTMTIAPPTCDKKSRCRTRNFPSAPDNNPKDMNTSVNPSTNKRALRMIRRRSCASAVTPPARKPIYAGIKGKVQGARKVSIPPSKAENIFTSDMTPFYMTNEKIRTTKKTPEMIRCLPELHQEITFLGLQIDGCQK
jgi:hypothetical protein